MRKANYRLNNIILRNIKFMFLRTKNVKSYLTIIFRVIMIFI